MGKCGSIDRISVNYDVTRSTVQQTLGGKNKILKILTLNFRIVWLCGGRTTLTLAVSFLIETQLKDQKRKKCVRSSMWGSGERRAWLDKWMTDRPSKINQAELWPRQQGPVAGRGGGCVGGVCAIRLKKLQNCRIDRAIDRSGGVLRETSFMDWWSVEGGDC